MARNQGGLLLMVGPRGRQPEAARTQGGLLLMVDPQGRQPEAARTQRRTLPGKLKHTSVSVALSWNQVTVECHKSFSNVYEKKRSNLNVSVVLFAVGFCRSVPGLTLSVFSCASFLCIIVVFPRCVSMLCIVYHHVFQG